MYSTNEIQIPTNDAGVHDGLLVSTFSATNTNTAEPTDPDCSPVITDIPVSQIEMIADSTAERLRKMMNPCTQVVFADDPVLAQKEALDLFHKNLVASGRAKSTIKSYETCVCKFLDSRKKHVAELDINDLREFLCELSDSNYTLGSIKSWRSTLKTFYTETLHLPYVSFHLPPMKGKKKLPFIYSREQISALFKKCTNRRDKAIFALAYGSGLRVSEICALKIEDIDAKKMRIRVNDGKGGKDRFTVLGGYTLEVLRDYLKHDWKNIGYSPESREWPKYLFPGRKPGSHIVPATAENALKRWLPEIGLPASGTMHRFRHSFATHALENGVPLHVLKMLMGHKSITATYVYLRLADISTSKVVSPADELSR